MTDITTPASMREAAALLTCPFCGGSNAHILPVKRGDKHRMYPLVRCMGCYLDLPGQNGDYSTDGRTAIAAWNRRALPVAEPAPVAVRVKPLKWVDRNGFMTADTAFGQYVLMKAGQNGWDVIAPDDDGFDCYFPTEQGAISAAQADHDARVLSQIDAVPAAQVRAEALEEAATKATSFLVGDPHNGVPLRNPMAHEIAASIRALIEKEPA